MDKILSRLFLISISILVSLLLVEGVANFYLWNITDEDTFKRLASAQQLEDRYGIDIFGTDTTRGGSTFVAQNYIGYAPVANFRNERGNYHNSYGFRGPEVTVPKPDETYRIVALGGSTTYSTGSRTPEGSYPFLLQQYLNENGYPNVEVVNAGVSGYTSYETLLNFQLRVLDLDPDLIIVYHATNDARARLIYPVEDYVRDNSGFIEPVLPSTIMPNILEYSTIARIIGIQTGVFTPHNSLNWTWRPVTESSVYELFTQQIRHGSYPQGIFRNMKAMDIIEQNPPTFFESNLRSIIGIAHANDIEVMFATWAWSNEFPEEPCVASEEFILMHRQHNEVKRQLSEEHDIYFYDFKAEMPDTRKYWRDGRHMVVEGNMLRAQLFGDYIMGNIFNSSD